jgi:DNA replication protein DnaC
MMTRLIETETDASLAQQELRALEDSRRPANLSADLPPCPCCEASAFDSPWRNLFDLQHNCDCIITHALAYESGLQRLWNARRHRERYLESLPARYRKYTFDALERHDQNARAFDALHDLEPGRTVFLFGNPGNGKTHLACATGFRLLERGSVVFWNVATLCATLRECVARDQPRPNLTSMDTLILDDLGKVKTSEFVYETLYACLEHRWSNERTTILTANHKPGVIADRLTPSSLDREAADAILSRLVAGLVLEVSGEDRREGRS